MLHIEQLESRELPSATVTLLGGTLAVVGDNANDVVDVFVNNAGAIVANVNGASRSFAAADVQRVSLDGGNGDDVLTSQVPTVPDFLSGGDGNDTLQAFGTTSVVLGGNGGDFLYAIVGVGAVVDGGQGPDRIAANATSIVAADQADVFTVVFGAGAAPFQLINGTLLFVGTAGNDWGMTVTAGDRLFVQYNGVSASFALKDVKVLAGVFGAGNDTFVNYSIVPQVMYGAGGNDTLLGGAGDDLLKGGGGDDFLAGRTGRDDITGDAGADRIDFGFAGNADGADILRVDQADLFFATAADLVIRRVL